MALLEVGRLTKEFPRRDALFGTRSVVRAVDDVTFSIEAGETFGLVGESGSGKTTTGRCILRLIEPTSGSVRFDGEDVLGFSSARMRQARREMQIVFQDPYSSLNPRMRARAIVEEPLIIHRIGSRADRRRRVADAAHRLARRRPAVDRPGGGRRPLGRRRGHRRGHVAPAGACRAAGVGERAALPPAT